MGSLTTRRVQASEWRWAAVFAALVMALTTLPYLVGAASQTDGWRFGGFVLGAEDGNSYIAKMGEGARGAWLFTLPYSSEPQRGVLIYAFYLLLGKLAGPGHEAQVVVYHLARVVCGFALLLVSYVFLAEFLPGARQRRLGLVLVAVGGGVGWLLTLSGHGYLFGSLPIDFISPEAYTFLILYSLPHLAAARCLFLLGLLAYLRGRGGAAGLALFGLGAIQPLSVLVAWAVMGADIVLQIPTAQNPKSKIQNPKFKIQISSLKFQVPTGNIITALLAGAISSPFVIYTAYIFSADPLFKQWSAQNVLPSPNPI
ncbi:MAG: hypothetical protein HY784_19515, partial [Chloroflexi bacterium]|nr:hypothetical protein [Chloroflexota bacterium]